MPRTEDPTPRTPLRWHKRHPQRWRRELAELRAAGYDYEIRRRRDRRVALLINIRHPNQAEPDDDHSHAQIRVEFPDLYPWFGASFYDDHDALGLTRHLQRATRSICLIHDEDRHIETTIAQTLTAQLPKLFRAQQPPTPNGEAAANDATARATPAELTEWPLAEPTQPIVSGLVPTITVPDIPIPADAESGHLQVRLDFNSRDQFGVGTIERITGPGVDIKTNLAQQLICRGFLSRAG